MNRTGMLGRIGVLGLLGLGMVALAARAQEPAEKAKAQEKAKADRPPGRPGFAPPLVSPEVQPDGRVTFRLRALDAKAVTVSGEWGGGAKPLARDDDGIWTVTLGPLKPDIYGYSFSVDGFQTLDPGNAWVKPMRSPRTSLVEVPADPPRLQEFQDVPHGTVRIHEYRSRSLGRLRRLHVYTPPGYDADTTTRYPVLYLFHGSGDNDATWTTCGRAHVIIDNLLAQRKAQPMVVVMPDGHAAPPQPRTAGTPGGPGGGVSRNVVAFERDLLEDVMPLVESSYRVRSDAAHRAIAGLSMGGGQSLTIGLNHPQTFAWIGGFSSAVFEPETTLSAALADPKATDRALRLVWIACGKDDRLIENGRRFSEALKEHGIRHEFIATEGNHSWPVWRRYLGEFAPLLFVEAP
jgi:enterochelin esterase family protein